MAYSDQQIPGWLQRNWQPNEPFDPTPWLQERFRREVIRAKLPLELQQLELANKANQLMIETKGLENDILNQEMDTYAKELPVYREWLTKVASTPGGAAVVPLPALNSKKLTALAADRLKMDADTTYGKAMSLRLIDETKRAGDAVAAGGPPPKRNPDGTFDPESLAESEAIARSIKQQEAIEKEQMTEFTRAAARHQADVAFQPYKLQEIYMREMAEADARIKAEKAGAPHDLAMIRERAIAEAKARKEYAVDPALTAAENLAATKAKLREHRQMMATEFNAVAEITPELRAAMNDEQRLADTVTALETQTGRYGTGRYGPEVTEKQALAIERAETRYEAAVASGDANEIQKSRRFLRNLRRAQEAQHRSETNSAQIELLKRQIANIDRQIVLPTMRAAYKELVKEREKLMEELKEWEAKREREAMQLEEDTEAQIKTPDPTTTGGTNAPEKRLIFTPGQGFKQK